MMGVGIDYERVFETDEGGSWLVGEPPADDSGVRLKPGQRASGDPVR